MKRFLNLRMFAASTLIGLVMSYILTLVAWNLVEHRMFRCIDDIGFTYVVENVDDHRLAGDTLCPGWTWGEVKTARLVYLAAFFSLWFAIAAAPRWAAFGQFSCYESVA
jgi:hypothetical protein